ncbi:MAG: aspartate aminotransferase family protein [Candidatus Abyssobacteria bacterium SURF_5]|uniref:alanine--glyoxylate transaminase n=1 Tax=Abyssobacteria bacterium (strain SURF_5) TaxID=2093360 RepID=A0A3A4P8J0_ABYX5|nr:MAG: aspartate aminotransferase family protein [Candidatus Abyssubacteria bacterium SURF_5]
MQLVRGKGQYLFDHTGKQYLDCYSGVSVVNAGHCHPYIVDRICEQVRTLQHTTTIYLTQPIVDLAERLAAIMPGDIKKSFFCASGSEANEGAALLAQIYTGRSEMLALRHGLHGRTKLTMSLTGLSFWRTDPAPVGGITHVAGPYCYRCPLGLSVESCEIECALEVKAAITTSTSGRVAAFFAEPIQGNGGIITPPPGYFERVREILDHYEILFVSDEVQTGYGRTGKMFGCQHYDIMPDIVTSAKALANGTPIGAFSTTDSIAACFTRPSASTLGGNPVSSTAALATLDVIEDEGLVSRAEFLGGVLKQRFLELQDRHRLIGDVRGKGLMLGIELVGEEKAPAAEDTDHILELLKNAGVLAGKTGAARNVLTFQPPLVIEEEDIDRLTEALESVFSFVEP